MTMSCRMMTRMARTASVAPVMNANAIVWTVFSDKNGLPVYHRIPASRRRGPSPPGRAVRRTSNSPKMSISAAKIRFSRVTAEMNGFRAGPLPWPSRRYRRIATAERLMTSVMTSRTTATPNRAL